MADTNRTLNQSITSDYPSPNHKTRLNTEEDGLIEFEKTFLFNERELDYSLASSPKNGKKPRIRSGKIRALESAYREASGNDTQTNFIDYLTLLVQIFKFSERFDAAGSSLPTVFSSHLTQLAEVPQLEL